MVKQLYTNHEGESSQSDTCYYEAEGSILDTSEIFRFIGKPL